MNFFDKNPVCHPWPDVLRTKLYTYKPREVFFAKEIEKINLRKGEKVLEVGCGEGILLDQLFIKYGIMGYGIDASEVAIQKAKKSSKNHFVLGDATKIPHSNQFFDAVITFDTMEHIVDQKKMVSEMLRVLKPNGRLIIFTINVNQKYTWNWFLNKIGIDIYKNVDHDPKLFVDPGKLKEDLLKQKVVILNLNYFNSLFTLIADELIMVFLLLWRKIFGWKKTNKYGEIILKLLTWFSIMITPICYFLEYPYRIFKKSNSFLIVGQKTNESNL